MMNTATHLLTVSFDDGFAKSFSLAAALHEEFGLKAQLNIIAAACESGFVSADEYQNAPLGNWELWNELAARGHEIGPHSWSHRNHTQIPFLEAQAEIDRCLSSFCANLKGFKADNATYAMPYNVSNPQIERYLDTLVRGYRTGGPGLNPLPEKTTRRLTCTGFGPGNCEAHLDQQIDQWLAAPRGWLIYNTHGFDEEGWGPLTPDYLRRLYARLLKNPDVRIVTFADGFSC